MDNKVFELILILKIQDLVSLIIDDKHLEFKNAIHYLYDTKLYESLSNEETKLWHLSSEKLFEILEIEKSTNELIYPDFV